MDAATPRARAESGLTALQFGRSLYVPLVQLAGGEGSVRPKDATLNDGERRFVEALRDYVAAHADEFADKDVFLLRNRSRGKGLGFFEAGNFYPDFLLWLVEPGMTRLAFVDPKGLRQMTGGQNDPKIRFAKDIKEIEAKLGRTDLTLESFIWSQTPYQDLGWHEGPGKLTQEELTDAHVLFPGPDPGASVRTMLELMAG